MSGAGASWASSEGSRRSMLVNRRRDTSPELAVRRLLRAAGWTVLRFWEHEAPAAVAAQIADAVRDQRSV